MNLLEIIPGKENGGFCASTANIWQYVGIILLVLKIVIPILLIILGMIDLGKAVISSEDKAVSKAAKKLLLRILAAVMFYFIPTIVSAVFLLMASFSEEAKDDFNVCRICIEHPNDNISKITEHSCNYYVSIQNNK